MIIVKDLTYSYPEADYPTLEGINLDIREGEFVLLIGPTGSGKSTFLYCLNGLIPHVFAGDIRGDIRINGISPQEITVAEISRIVGTVFQNPESQIFMLKVEDDVAFGCENLSLPKEEVIKRRDMALKEMGLLHVRNAETFNLSGGMKQRLAISSIYAMGPNIFLFDEPTTDLDSKGRGELLGIIRKLKEKGNTILLVEHQYEDFLPVTDRVIILENGKIINETKSFHSIRTVSRERRCFKGYSSEIDIQDLTFGYRKEKPILKDINLNIRRGELIAVCGENGSGKTTLLKIMAGLLKPDKGRFALLGFNNPAIEELIGRVGFLFQNPDEQLFANSVEEEIMFGPLQLKKKVDKEKYLKLANFNTVQKKHPQTLSRGQRQLLAILSILAMEPQVIILDEPTTGLDYNNLCSLFKILNTLVNENKTVIFSTHHMGVKEFADRAILLEDGRIVSDEIYK